MNGAKHRLPGPTHSESHVPCPPFPFAVSDETASPPAREQIIAPIRNSVRALIMRHNRVLLLRKQRPDGGPRYVLPGGGQELGESIEQTLWRECLEEIGVPVDMVALLHVAEIFKARDTRPKSFRQQIEFIFDCRVPADYVAGPGEKPDKGQLAVEWIDLSQIDVIDLWPTGTRKLVRQAALRQGPVYLGPV